MVEECWARWRRYRVWQMREQEKEAEHQHQRWLYQEHWRRVRMRAAEVQERRWMQEADAEARRAAAAEARRAAARARRAERRRCNRDCKIAGGLL